jgi:hypothetical protein
METVVTNTVIKGRALARATHQGWRSAALAVAATSMVLVGCGSEDSTPETTPDDRVSTSASSTAPTSSETPTESALEGTWRTGSISPQDAEATLRREGFSRFVKDFRANAPFSTDTVLILSIEGGQWNLYGESQGKPAEPIDYDAEYEIDGDTVTFHHSSGSNTYQWTVEADELRLEFVKSTLPPYEGVPEEVFQRALYMTQSFTKRG